jgi:hypothetical protein
MAYHGVHLLCDILTETSALITEQQMANPVTQGEDFDQAFFTIKMSHSFTVHQ